jgi:hypothetical protein
MNMSATIEPTTTEERSRTPSASSSAALVATRARNLVIDRDRWQARSALADLLRLLADTMTIRDMYAAYGERGRGLLARVFELICQRHCTEHARLTALLGAHIRALGGDAMATTAAVAATTRLPLPARRHDSMDVQIERLLNAHESIAEQSIALAASCSTMNEHPRDETALVASELILTGKLHVWLLGEHLKHASSASTAGVQFACGRGRLVLPFC